MDTSSPNHPKAEIRRLIRAARAARSPAEVAEADASRTARLARRLARLGPAVVAAYWSNPDEPDTAVLIGDLAEAGVRVLLPAMTPGHREVVDWAVWSEPTGEATAGRRLGPQGLAQADLVILPGLAGTPSGHRLGRGAGWYDRALLAAQTDVPRWLLLYDDEVLPDLPVEPHDQVVSAIVTERRWLDCTFKPG